MTGVQTCALPILGDVRLTFHDAESFHTRMGHTAALMLAHPRGGPQKTPA